MKRRFELLLTLGVLVAVSNHALAQTTYAPGNALAPDPAAVQPRGPLTPMTQAAAQSSGNALGSLAAPAVTPFLNSGSAPVLTPNSQGSTANQQSYFAGGWGNTVGPGSSQSSLCVNGGTAGIGQVAPTDPQCIAAQVVATSKTTRPPISITPTDPLITGNAALFSSPQLTAGTPPAAYSDCVTNTQTTPGQTTTQSCNDRATLGTGACVRPDIVTVKSEYDYQCNYSTAQTTVNTCPQTATVTVTWIPSCKITSVTSTPLGSYQDTYACNAANIPVLYLNVIPADMCQYWTSGWCNATYHQLAIPWLNGSPASGSQNMGNNSGNGSAPMFTFNWSYDGASTITVTQPAPGPGAGPGYQALGWYLPPNCPANETYMTITTGTPPFTSTQTGCGIPATVTSSTTATCPVASASIDGTCSTFLGGSPTPTTTNGGLTWTCTGLGWATTPTICGSTTLTPATAKATFTVNGGPINIPQVSAPTWTDSCTAFEARL